MLMYRSFKGCQESWYKFADGKTSYTKYIYTKLHTRDMVLMLHQCVVFQSSGTAPIASMSIWVGSSETFTVP